MPPPAGDADRLGLVAVQAQRMAVGRASFAAEDPRAFLVEYAFRHQFVNGRAGLEGGVELDQRLWPEVALGQALFDKPLDLGVGDVQEGPDVVRVAVDHIVAKLKDVQAMAPIPHGRRMNASRLSSSANRSSL